MSFLEPTKLTLVLLSDLMPKTHYQVDVLTSDTTLTAKFSLLPIIITTAVVSRS